MNTIQQAVRTEVTDFLTGLPMEFLQCRDVGHSWRGMRAEWVPGDRCYLRELECMSCEATKIQWLDQSGHIISRNSPVYPPGYLHKGGGRLNPSERDAVHLTSVTRLIG